MMQDRSGVSAGQNRKMPIQLPYPAGAPNGVARALRAMSAPTRVSTIRYLLDHESATPGEIIAATAATAVHPALIELEKLGFITGDVPAGERRGKPVRYALNHAEFQACIDALHAWITPSA